MTNIKILPTAVVAALLTVPTLASAKNCDDPSQSDAPLPSYTIAGDNHPLLGVWAGSWAKRLCHILVVKKVEDGKAFVIYSIGRSLRATPKYYEATGVVGKNSLELRLISATIKYRLAGDSLRGQFLLGGRNTAGTFRKVGD